MIVEQFSNKSDCDPEEQLDQFESTWLAGEIPNVKMLFNRLPNASSQFLRDLIELDLEYRWKRFDQTSTHIHLDPHQFPSFPVIEDYINLLEDSKQISLLTPELLAEEYRVRTLWGDHPGKENYLDRLPHESANIEQALHQIDTEFIIEKLTPRAHLSSDVDIYNSTRIASRISALSQDQPSDSKPGQEIGKYRLEEMLGRGGFGEVWKAFDPTLKRYVALKFPRSDVEFDTRHLDYFRREAEKMATLERVSGVVPVFESGEFHGRPYIVSFLVDGEDLRVRQKKNPPSIEESVRIVADIAHTLNLAHLKNLFHRDIKPSNILLDQDDRCYLTDFGLCISEDEQLEEGHSTLGTYAYMAPEQLRGDNHHVDGRADIYSLGMVLYLLLTGRLPYKSETPREYVDQALHREPRPPRSINDRIPQELERICLKCLNKKISERYTTSGDLADDLQNYLNRLTGIGTLFNRRSATAAILLVGVAFFSIRPFISVDPGINPPIDPGTQSIIQTVTLTPVLSSGNPQNNFINVSEIANSAQLSSDQLLMVKLGRLDFEQETIRVTMKNIGDRGASGVFLGFRNRTTDDKQQFQMIRISKRRDGKICLTRSLQKFYPSTPGSRSSEDSPETCVENEIEEHTITVQILKGALQSVYWNGELIDQVHVMPIESPETEDLTGIFGVFTDQTSAVFSQIERNQQQPILRTP